MALSERDVTILEHITAYCNDISDMVIRFGNSIESFQTDKAYRNACAMCILQIGELVGHLSEAFRREHAEMPWNEIKAMRNVVVHAYGSISVQTTWETIEQDIPVLKAFCERVMAEG